MIVIDTSIWIDNQRNPVHHLEELITTNLVRIHPLVIGELACGFLSNRALFLRLLGNLPQSPRATDPEVLFFIEQHKLYGKGMGYIDAHLLASATLGRDKIWTRDKRLAQIASSLNLVHPDRP
jgi:predicted nucleic acid-binding protein